MASRTKTVQINPPRPPSFLERVLIPLLFLTTVLGTLWSLKNFTLESVSFRSRLPASDYLGAPLDGLSGMLPELPSYFANKRNFFNMIFVKRAWAWTTLCFIAWVTSQLLQQGRSSSIRQGAVRFFTATAYWLLITSWFFGPSIFHRVLVFSGAQCFPSALSSTSYPIYSDATTGTTPAAQILDPSMCSSNALYGLDDQIKYFWKGGHDISGHVFMMVHSMLFLLSTFGVSIKALAMGNKKTIKNMKDGAVKESVKVSQATPLEQGVTVATLALCALWWWMLLMTSAFFHTPLEKLSGFIVGALGYYFGETAAAIVA